MNHHHHITYIEFPTVSIAKSREFFKTIFGWSFTDYGPDYTSFSDEGAGVAGGFFSIDQSPAKTPEATLVVLYSSDLEATQQGIVEAGGRISKETFSYPGGRRFHFIEPGGNELGVWSEDEDADPEN